MIKNCFILICLFFLSCNTNQEVIVPPAAPGMTSGILTDFTGLDGCGWVITLKEKNSAGVDKLEPVNIATFNLTLVDGQAVEFTYEKTEGASICMVGQRVTLKTIRVIK